MRPLRCTEVLEKDAKRSSGVENIPRSCGSVSACRVRNISKGNALGQRWVVKRVHTERPTLRPCLLKLLARFIAAKILVARVPRPDVAAAESS